MAIQIKKYSPTEHRLKALIYWNAKTWKTTFAGTAPRPLFICAENGLLSIANKAPDFVEVKTLQELKDLYKRLKETKPDYDTIVIDSLSEISKIIKDNLTNQGSKQMILRDWWVFSEEMMQAVRQIVNLPYHVVCIVHTKEVLDEAGAIQFYELSIETKAKNEVTRYFDVIGFSHIDKEWEYKISIRGSSKTLGGDRSNTIDKDNTPLSVQEWINSIAKIGVGAVTTQAVVTEIESAASEAGAFTMLESLNDQYDKINKAIDKDNSEANKNIIKFNVSKAKNLSPEEKENLTQYITLK